MAYFGILTYAAYSIIRNEDDNHHYATGATLITMGIECFIMLFNGQVSQRMDPLMFMSLYVLFNIYIWFITYLYAPNMDFSSKVKKNIQPEVNITDADRERAKIMNEFYEVEMKEDDIEDRVKVTKAGVVGLKKQDKKKVKK